MNAIMDGRGDNDYESFNPDMDADLENEKGELPLALVTSKSALGWRLKLRHGEDVFRVPSCTSSDDSSDEDEDQSDEE